MGQQLGAGRNVSLGFVPDEQKTYHIAAAQVTQLAINDVFNEVDLSAPAVITLTLPPVSQAIGRSYHFYIGADDGSASEVLTVISKVDDDGTTYTLATLKTAGDWLIVDNVMGRKWVARASLVA